MSKYIVTIGDSVHWGQGLAREHKLHTLVAKAIRAGVPDLVEHHMAHSGAVIGAGATVTHERVDGEVPVGSPTILEQAAAFPGDPADVLCVLANGGINDVDIKNILNPFISSRQLSDLTREHCYDSMRVLLEELVLRFPATTTRIIVTGYYPILSHHSAVLGLRLYLQLHGIDASLSFTSPLPHGTNPIVDHCLQFWQESTSCFIEAVAQVRTAHPKARVGFVNPGFTEQHAMFTADPWLFGLDPLLLPEDEVIPGRHGACDAAIPAHDILAREQCYRASAGHPNVAGARQYADAILEAI
ncbi:MAG: hypothetical protein ABI665_06170 [Vicinamibacterales bacterium]